MSVLEKIEDDLHPAKPKLAQKLILDEIEHFFNSVNDDLKSLTTRAGTILSILIAVDTALLGVLAITTRPPYWVILAPGVPLILAVIASARLFVGYKVVASPTIESLNELADKPEDKAISRLIQNYESMLVGGKGRFTQISNRARPRYPPEPAGFDQSLKLDDGWSFYVVQRGEPKTFPGILAVLRKKQLLFDASVILLGITLVLVVAVSLAVYVV